VDEPAWRGREAMDQNVRCLKILKGVPRQRTEQDGPGDDYFHHEAGPWADFWNYNGAYAPPEIIAEAKAAGHSILIYNNDVEGYRPEVDRYAAGFHLALAGSHGVFNWEYRGGSGDLYDDLDGPSGDWVMHHLPNDRYRGGPATGWEGFREGIDDQRYLTLLQSVIVQAHASGNRHAIRRASRAQKLLGRLLDSLHYSPRLRGAAQFERTSVSADGTTQFRGKLKVPNGWDYAMYDRARWQIAQCIVAILRALGDLPEKKPSLLPHFPTGKLLVDHVKPLPGGPTPSEGRRPMATAPPVATAPMIDGKLDDDAWQRPPSIDGVLLASGDREPQAGMQAWLAVDHENLYVAARCDEPQTDGIVANVTEDGGDVWQDDCVELFIDPRRSRGEYLQVVVNSIGAKWTEWHGREAAAPEVQAAASVGEGEWSVELAIPRRPLPDAREQMGLNICRERRADGRLELSCWSPTGGAFGRPERFGDLLVGCEYIAAIELPRLVVGPNPTTITVRNDGGKTASLTLEVKAKTGTVRAGPVRLRRGEEQAVLIDLDLSVGGAPEPVTIRVLGDLGLPVEERELALAAALPVRVAVEPALTYDTDEAMLLTVELDVSDQVRRRCELEVGRKRGNEFEVLAAVDRAPQRGLSAVLRAVDLTPGEYTIAARLVERRKGGLQLLGETELVRIPGPFGEEGL
jgi:hypothetical protein